jgi:hypothetical protein
VTRKFTVASMVSHRPRQALAELVSSAGASALRVGGLGLSWRIKAPFRPFCRLCVAIIAVDPSFVVDRVHSPVPLINRPARIHHTGRPFPTAAAPNYGARGKRGPINACSLESRLALRYCRPGQPVVVPLYPFFGWRVPFTGSDGVGERLLLVIAATRFQVDVCWKATLTAGAAGDFDGLMGRY